MKIILKEVIKIVNVVKEYIMVKQKFQQSQISQSKSNHIMTNSKVKLKSEKIKENTKTNLERKR